MVFGRSKSSSSTASPPPAAAASSAAAAACSELRAAYHECFNRWYAEKFAKGQWHKDDCVGEWHKYRACLEVTPFSPPPNSITASLIYYRSPQFVAKTTALGIALVFSQFRMGFHLSRFLVYMARNRVVF
ncbi:Os09g0361700 [Oryza sativa Japonica Group]|uniref:Os09g0361700 protein n=2 Tax=Oryza TaxID=4527 RepID=B7F1Z9_ORYSJ|nr:hypothetical protein EE612_047289 [Oryza sativa]BAG98646.1 unnamed protein product [Oryza sativa Japonica Group]BAT07701.1 Os09g0361700 [Oryza sativa Japonica Group]